jgi:hypothetical protein
MGELKIASSSISLSRNLPTIHIDRYLYCTRPVVVCMVTGVILFTRKTYNISFYYESGKL